MQSLDNHLKVIWGAEEFFEGQSSSSRVNGELSIAELASAEYHWMRRGFSIEQLPYNKTKVLYTFTGSKKRDGKTLHTSYRSDDLQIQAQLTMYLKF